MSSSMMRGLPHNNSALNISSRRDNLIIEIDDSNDDSDDNTLQIVEDESIEIDESASDEPVAIDLSIKSTKYRSLKNGNSDHRLNLTKHSKCFSTPPKVTDQPNNRYPLPKLTVVYQPHHYEYLKQVSKENGSNTLNSPHVTHQQSNGFNLEIKNGENLPTISLHISEVAPPINESHISEVAPAINESFTYQCEFCSETFSSDQLLIDHCARMHTKDVKCQHCEKTFYREKDLHFHMRTHIKKGRGFRCQICTGLFLKGAELKEHMKIHDIEDSGTEGSYPCDICDKRFKSSRTLQDHKKRFFHKQCEVCLEYFSTDATLYQHFSVHVTQTVATYNCDQCEETFTKKSLLKLHRDKHRLYVCELCSTEFRRKDDIKSHLRMDCTKRSLFHCTVCNKSFISERNLKEHVDIHYDRNRCEFCLKKFLRSSELFEHLDRHDIEHPYKCQYCLVPMSSKRIFNFHLKSHNDKTKYKCERCCRWFRSRYNLQTHIKTHSKDSFKCDICSMSFPNALRHNQHLASHRDNEFECDICKRSFRTRHLIFLHMVNSHQSKKKCHICEKEFKNQSRLMTHLKSHYVKVEFPDDEDGM